MKFFSYVKPDAFKENEDILHMLSHAGYKIISKAAHTITEKEANELYVQHEGRPYFERLITHTTSGPSLLLFLNHPKAGIKEFRELIGNSDPGKAAEGTIRKLFGNATLYAQGIPANAIHGSDSEKNFFREISIFEEVFP